MRYIVITLICLFCFGGCGSSATILSWKPTIVVENGANSTATASPTQPVTISDNTATGLPTP